MEPKKLSLEEMEEIEGGRINTASAICGLGFAGYAGIYQAS